CAPYDYDGFAYW
nr:immunoglobulin heavy chain junction region [Mus musculus]MBK4184107.1 immunoglobulin heavy chain junction region [Mus musculus]MBK4184108.1 immunoglobulin heavy chain junction region [Mus musculus]MBK4197258.1 immunoglobulin heavy chain junction region [Mus musculus]